MLLTDDRVSVFIDGTLGDHVLLAPPFIIESAQIDELVGKLTKGLGVALKP